MSRVYDHVDDIDLFTGGKPGANNNLTLSLNVVNSDTSFSMIPSPPHMFRLGERQVVGGIVVAVVVIVVIVQISS